MVRRQRRRRKRAAEKTGRALVRRRAGVRGAPHRGRAWKSRQWTQPPRALGAAGFGSKHETDFARKRALDDVAKHVLLNGRVQKICAPEGDRYAVSRPYAGARIQDLI